MPTGIINALYWPSLLLEAQEIVINSPPAEARNAKRKCISSLEEEVFIKTGIFPKIKKIKVD